MVIDDPPAIRRFLDDDRSPPAERADLFVLATASDTRVLFWIAISPNSRHLRSCMVILRDLVEPLTAPSGHLTLRQGMGGLDTVGGYKDPQPTDT